MTPVLVTAPASPVVSVPDLKLFLRVDSADEDSLIADMEAEAVAYLDGWKGVLGRAILAQTWAQEFEGWGCLRLRLPDVISVTVTGYDANGGAVPPDLAQLKWDQFGAFVDAAGGSAAKVRVEYVCALPAQQLPSARFVVKSLVSHWYFNREAAASGSMTQVPMAAEAVIDALRWRQF